MVLYPPILDDSINGQLIEKIGEDYFITIPIQISNLNNFDYNLYQSTEGLTQNETGYIRDILISIQYVDTNVSALNPVLYPAGVYSLNPSLTEYDYEKRILKAKICLNQVLNNWSLSALGKFYKIQAKFAAGNNPASNPWTDVKLTTENTNGNLSSWSRTSIIKTIQSSNNFMLNIDGLLTGKNLYTKLFEETVDSLGNPNNLKEVSTFPSYTYGSTQVNDVVTKPLTYPPAGTALSAGNLDYTPEWLAWDLLYNKNYYLGNPTDEKDLFSFSGKYSSIDPYENLDTYSVSLYKLDNENDTFLSDEKIVEVLYNLKPEDYYQNHTRTNTKIMTAIESKLKFKFETALSNLTWYSIKINYVTKTGYEGTYILEAPFQTLFENLYYPNLKAEYTIDEYNGRIGIKVTSNTQNLEELGLLNGTKYIIFERSSYLDNYQKWETLDSVAFKPFKNLDLPAISNIFYDYTAESGVLYKYKINGNLVSDIPQMGIYEDIYLVGKNNQQLRIRYNPKISSFKISVNESLTTTMGNKYPIYNRNGDNYYHSFDLSGLITFFSDEDEIFISEDDLFVNNSEEFFKAYNKRYSISGENDILKEKLFRDAVMKFLYNGEVKLFKSATEGNFLVALTDISLSPIEALGRRLYEFSCNVTELADCNVTNLKKYNLFAFDSYLAGMYFSKMKIFKMKRDPAEITYLKESDFSPIVPVGSESEYTVNKQTLNLYCQVKTEEVNLVPLPKSSLSIDKKNFEENNYSWDNWSPIYPKRILGYNVFKVNTEVLFEDDKYILKPTRFGDIEMVNKNIVLALLKNNYTSFIEDSLVYSFSEFKPKTVDELDLSLSQNNLYSLESAYVDYKDEANDTFILASTENFDNGYYYNWEDVNLLYASGTLFSSTGEPSNWELVRDKNSIDLTSNQYYLAVLAADTNDIVFSTTNLIPATEELLLNYSKPVTIEKNNFKLIPTLNNIPTIGDWIDLDYSNYNEVNKIFYKNFNGHKLPPFSEEFGGLTYDWNNVSPFNFSPNNWVEEDGE